MFHNFFSSPPTVCLSLLNLVPSGCYHSDCLVLGGCHPQAILACRAKFITCHLSHPKRGILMGSSIFLWWLHMSLNLCISLTIEMTLIFYLLRTFCSHLGSFLCYFFLHYVSTKFHLWPSSGDFTATSDRNAESCNRIPSNYCLPQGPWHSG